MRVGAERQPRKRETVSTLTAGASERGRHGHESTKTPSLPPSLRAERTRGHHRPHPHARVACTHGVASCVHGQGKKGPRTAHLHNTPVYTAYANGFASHRPRSQRRIQCFKKTCGRRAFQVQAPRGRCPFCWCNGRSNRVEPVGRTKKPNSSFVLIHIRQATHTTHRPPSNHHITTCINDQLLRPTAPNTHTINPNSTEACIEYLSKPTEFNSGDVLTFAGPRLFIYLIYKASSIDDLCQSMYEWSPIPL